ncbi:MAG: hypothetical protein SWO11_01330 [Thermodesulfobacteriota bacterium]|nr:hypothetical protein [Thermodesulfobacteriota bacterium]
MIFQTNAGIVIKKMGMRRISLLCKYDEAQWNRFFEKQAREKEGYKRQDILFTEGCNEKLSDWLMVRIQTCRSLLVCF